MKQEEEFRSSNLICCTETWLNEDHSVDIERFTTIQANREKVKSLKSVGRGLCMYVEKNWSLQSTIIEQTCTLDYETLVASFRPFYLI